MGTRHLHNLSLKSVCFVVPRGENFRVGPLHDLLSISDSMPSWTCRWQTAPKWRITEKFPSSLSWFPLLALLLLSITMEFSCVSSVLDCETDSVFLYKLALKLSPRQDLSSLFSFFFFYSLRSVAGGSKVSILQRENGYSSGDPTSCSGNVYLHSAAGSSNPEDPYLHNHFQKGWEAQNASRGVPRQEKHEGSRATTAPSHRSGKQETLEDPNKFVSHEPSSFSQLSM